MSTTILFKLLTNKESYIDRTEPLDSRATPSKDSLGAVGWREISQLRAVWGAVRPPRDFLWIPDLA